MPLKPHFTCCRINADNVYLTTNESLLVWSEEKWKSCPTLCNPMDHAVHGILQARILEWVAFSSPGDLPNPGIKPRSPTLQIDSLPAEPQEKPKNTGMGSLSLLQQIFLIQESNRRLLHCRLILYQLSHLVFYLHCQTPTQQSENEIWAVTYYPQSLHPILMWGSTQHIFTECISVT